MTKRTFTAPADIARLTSIINAGVPAPPSVAGGMSCAPVAIVYTLRFTPRAAPGPSAVVTLGACPQAYAITVDGKPQPSLWDNGKLRTAARPTAQNPVPARRIRPARRTNHPPANT